MECCQMNNELEHQTLFYWNLMIFKILDLKQDRSAIANKKAIFYVFNSFFKINFFSKYVLTSR